MKPNQLLALVIERLRALEKRLYERIDGLSGRITEVAEFKAVPGPKGEQGPKGEPGIGEKGEQGAIGETGPQGLTGERGPEGKPGKDGRDGKDGKQGKTGERGPKGDTGPSGPSGVGMRGPAGRDGIDGKDGKDGEVPDHQVKDDRIRFKKPNDNWGKWLDLKAITNVYSGGAIQAQKAWIDYAVGYSEEPVLLGSFGIGEVYQYNYTDNTLYRVIGTSSDIFYSLFADGVATNIVAQRAL